MFPDFDQPPFDFLVNEARKSIADLFAYYHEAIDKTGLVPTSEFMVERDSATRIRELTNLKDDAAGAISRAAIVLCENVSGPEVGASLFAISVAARMTEDDGRIQTLLTACVERVWIGRFGLNVVDPMLRQEMLNLWLAELLRIIE